MAELTLVPRGEFERVRPLGDLALIADMCRANALTAVKRAGSGHLGSSFSSLDVVVHLLWRELNVAVVGWEHPDRDVFFSSKGHDVPGLYAALHALGVIPPERLQRLRRLGGLDGHPDVGVPGIEANSGSLGMGLSKARGMAWAKSFLGRAGTVVVMTGDGELQEGQNWEALAAAAHQRIGNLWAIVDRNELQSDKPTEDILALGDLGGKLRTFGWHVETCDGHDHAALETAFAAMRSAPPDVPKVLIAQTIKGRGVSFMEHPAALREADTYRWHAGAPDDEAFRRAHAEIVERVRRRVPDLRLEPVAPVDTHTSLEGEPESGIAVRHVSDEYVAAAYGDELQRLVAERADLVVLDADLASDCRIRGVELEQPDRFIEVGIAEQDLVSMAAGLARQGLLPVVNSFAAFLAARANEQIYNQASERTKVVYALHYAGLIPAGPGKSHQSIRDVSLLAALPNVAIVQPANAAETRALVRWAVEEAAESVAIRLAIGPSPRRLDLPETVPGRGSLVRDGFGAVLFAYGPVMLHEALTAAEALGDRLQVVNLPWLNRIDGDWLMEVVEPFEEVFVLEDHAPVGGLGDVVRRLLPGRRVTVFGVEGWPACGTPPEALRFHGLDGSSLADRIAVALAAVQRG
jgi:transketolase